MLYLILFASMAIGISFVCSILEATLLSITPSYIAHLKHKNKKLHRKLVKFKTNIDTSLASILTLNTIANTVGAAGVGAMVVDLYGQVYLGIASGVMTVTILLFSEIIPKSIGAKYWRNLASFMCFMLTGMIFILRPFLYISNFIMRLIGEKKYDASTLRGEIKALSKIAREEKVIDEGKYRIIKNIMDLHNVKVKDVMTPRTVVQYVLPGTTIREFDKFLETATFSRFPIVDEVNGVFLGYIHKSSSYQAEENDVVEKFAHPTQSFYSEAKLENVLSAMLDESCQMGLVIDHHETWVGIITLEDIIETILGKEIVDETDEVADMQLYAKIKWAQKQKEEKEEGQF